MMTWDKVVEDTNESRAWGSLWRCECGGPRVLLNGSTAKDGGWVNLCKCKGSEGNVHPVGVVDGQLVIRDEKPA